MEQLTIIVSIIGILGTLSSIYFAYKAVNKNKLTEEKDLKKIMRRDKWCVENLQKFSNLARVNTSNYKIKTVIVTHHKNAAEYINPHLSNIPFVWIRELIDNPMDIFKKC